MSSSSNNINNNNSSSGIFLNQSSTAENERSQERQELNQPSIKRQRIDEQNKNTTKVLKATAFLDDSGNSTSSSSSSPSPVAERELNDSECLSAFQTQLIEHQCLCGLSERVLKVPFQYYYSTSVRHSDDDPVTLKNSSSDVHYVKSLKLWPEEFLLKYLSNIQLLFHVYLKQNAKGNICGKIMEICDCLIRNEITIFENLIELCNGNCSNFISLVASKVITYFLIIIKDEIDQEWLKKIVDNLFTFDHLDYAAVRRINFSLDIIRCIVEWKDHDEHILEEEDMSNGAASNANAPPIETNYFATFHHDGGGPSTSALPPYLIASSSTNSSASHHSGRSSATSGKDFNQIHYFTLHNMCLNQTGHNSPITNGCHFVQLTDSESFDTTHIKCITIKILENKWPALVKNISTLITELSTAHFRQQHRTSSTTSLISNSSGNFNNAENCILTFIALWESIISVKTNLSVIETLPFYAHLVHFEFLLNQNLPNMIYKQMLQLFNEALCYGSTLALQDLLPEETCSLAHQIVRHVKDLRLLESMPRHQQNHRVTGNNFFNHLVCYLTLILKNIDSNGETDDNLRTLIGNNCETVVFSPLSWDARLPLSISADAADSQLKFDKSLLQKMTLLVLKSVAVSVKEIRSDSSDSSIDSTDYEAFQEMMMIERSIRDVLKKLESFIKNTLEFHPESHFSKILIHLFDDQDDFLIEAMVCTLDVTSGISFRNNAFPELVAMLNPVYTFLEFLKMISNSCDLLLDLLVSNETCFLLYLLRFLKYIRLNWSMFVLSCRDCGMGSNVLDDTMTVMTRLRFKIGRLVSKSLYPYDIAPVLRLLESCENLYEGNELS
jgi:hypothetical protein